MPLCVTKKCFPPSQYCHNCKRKGRGAGITEEPRKEDFSRCSGCHLMTYCDKDCQKEHWIAVHKHHCSFLSGKKLPVKSKHEPSSCDWCIQEMNTTSRQILDASSPKTNCHIEFIQDLMKMRIGTNLGFHVEGKTCGCSLKDGCELPFSLGEVSGEYVGTGSDEVLAHAIRLASAMVNKMKCQTVNKLFSELIKERSALWTRVLIYGEKGEILPSDIMSQTITDLLKDVQKYFGLNNAWLKALKFSVHLANNMKDLLIWKNIDLKNLEDPRFGHMKKIYLLEESKFRNLSTISKSKLWPTLSDNRLVLLLPDGVRCDSCDTKLSGEVAAGDQEPNLPDLVPVVGGGNGGLVAICSSDRNPTCYVISSIKHFKINEDEDKYRKEFKVFLSKSRVCDVCIVNSFSSHRCSSCLAAQYCSTKCQKKDLDFHKTVCDAWAQDKRRRMVSSSQQKKVFKKLPHLQK